MNNPNDDLCECGFSQYHRKDGTIVYAGHPVPVKADPIKDKILELWRKNYGFKGGATMKMNDLNDLVDLARKTK